MSKASALLRTATIILATSIVVSGVNSAIADNGGAETIARKGVADLLVEQLFLKN